MTKVAEWLGYKLHLLVDVRHEVVLAYHSTSLQGGTTRWWLIGWLKAGPMCLPHASKPSAVERVNGRLKIYWGADDGNMTGATRFYAYVGVVLIVHVGMATLLARTARREGPLGQMELSPIAAALRERIAADQQA